MRILAVDLASTMWAACLGSGEGVDKEFCAVDFKSENSAVNALTHLFRPESSLDVSYLLIEDLPYGVLPNLAVKDVSRFQGRLIERMISYGQKDKLLFVQPMEWQRHFKVNKKRSQSAKEAIDGFAQCAFDLGYTPPDLVEIHSASFTSLHGTERSKVREALKKLKTDLVAAFLIKAWFFEVGEEKVLASKSVQKYLR